MNVPCRITKVCLLLFVGAAAVGCGGSVDVPSGYKSWNAKDGSFKVDYPETWEAKGGGKHGVQWAKFTSGPALIRVNIDVSSSLIGDIVNSGVSGIAGDFGGDEDLSAEAEVHQLKKDEVAAEMSNYSEEDPIKISTQLGDGRKSPFKAGGGVGGRIRGYRATVLSNNNGIHILCKCPDKYWDELKPHFDKILDSFEYGVPER